jgi:RNA polymerase sigma-70 factor (ECF subfamily)
VGAGEILDRGTAQRECGRSTVPDRLELFEAQRSRLLGIAYGMLGSLSDAEDVVQDAFLRWQRVPDKQIDSPEGYLRRVVTRLCIDHLRLLKRRREEYVGVWLPEPLVRTDDTPETMTVMADQLSVALLRILETLSPVERAVFLLCEVFGYEHAEVARMLGKTEANTRQILHRARRHITMERPRYPVSGEDAERLLAGFMQAASQGDIETLLSLLAEDVTWYADGGGKVPAATRPVRGAHNVARLVTGLVRKFPGFTTRFVEANGQRSILVFLQGRVFGVLIPHIVGGRIQEVDWVMNPDKLVRIKGSAH